jgi:hypothetical protein
VVSGPFDLRQLKVMRKLERLARFHEVSADGETWVPASSIAALYPAAVVGPARPNRQDPATSEPGVSQQAGGDAPLSQDSSQDAWFYAEGDQPCGPLGLQELQRLVAQGRLTPTTLVWCEGMANWVPYCELPSVRAGVPPGTE